MMVKADEGSLLSVHTEHRIIDISVPTSDGPNRDQWASLFVWLLNDRRRADGALVQQVRNQPPSGSVTGPTKKGSEPHAPPMERDWLTLRPTG
jgi:hypothetical protein